MAEIENDSNQKNFKFKELRVYSSTEWLADNKKKYRQVYDRFETTYVYAELSFYNKLFDQDVWEVDIILKCYSIKRNNKELCRLQFKRKVSKYDHVVYVREGWGNKKEGTFWKKGTYYWEAYINEEKVATKYFYVEDGGEEDEYGNRRYIGLKTLRLYEGQYDDVGQDDRKYYKVFSSADTRYIYAETMLSNLNAHESWQCELFTKFYNEARELKGQVIRLQTIKKGQEEVNISAGWGSNVKGSWREGRYTAEVVFLDHLIAIIPFEVREEFEEGISPVQLPNGKTSLVLYEDENFNQSFEEVMEELDALVGLKEIKKQVREHAQYIKFLQLRREKGFEEKEDLNIHSVFIGNPGTGKTTVASMMGKLYKKMGMLSKGHVHEVDRVDLVGEYIGQTAPKVKDAIEKARGGVLFIDEAYSLARANDDTKDFGREVIEILVKEMSNGPGDLVVIAAGYPKEMKYFLDSNPGLKSRFKLYYKFDDYLPQELSKIATYACHEKEVTLTEEALDVVDEMIVEAFRNRDRSFGNARYVFDIIEKAKVNLGLRIMLSNNPTQFSKKELAHVTLADVMQIDLSETRDIPNIPVDEKLLEDSLAELDQLIGMTNVKNQIRELVDLVRYYQLSGKSVLNKFYFHTVFVGNPGTGKTTVARILTKIYKSLGILERGHMVETDRQGLVAGYVGQTALKTAEKIDEAMGGVLFIDEAYALTSHPSASGDFGNEVIQTILKRMEDMRGKFFIFAAGYPDNMETFLKVNPGLSSRFDKMLKFEDYQPAELSQIAEKMIQDEGLKITSKALDHLSKYFNFLFEYRDKYFGNARIVRNTVQEAIKNQHLRLAGLLKENQRSINNLITYDDVKEFTLDKKGFVFNKKTIGFRRKSKS
jgi:SpoVK/Ycf46/Vps4 family AAA+-type ATPase